MPTFSGEWVSDGRTSCVKTTRSWFRQEGNGHTPGSLSVDLVQFSKCFSLLFWVWMSSRIKRSMKRERKEFLSHWGSMVWLQNLYFVKVSISGTSHTNKPKSGNPPITKEASLMILFLSGKRPSLERMGCPAPGMAQPLTHVSFSTVTASFGHHCRWERKSELAFHAIFILSCTY